MTVKSQSDLNKPETHSTEVLLSTIEELERTKRENLLLKVAIMELRDTLNTIEGKLIRAFYDDKMSFWDALVDIRKTIKKDLQKP
jgi:hypothetical protein